MPSHGEITVARLAAHHDKLRPHIQHGKVSTANIPEDGNVPAAPGVADADERTKLSKLVIHARVFCECITNSLTPNHCQRILPKLESFHHDGVALLAHLIADTHSTNALATRDHKAALQEISFKKNGNQIDRVHAAIETHVQAIESNGTAHPDEDKMLVLIRAHKTFNCQKWLTHVDMLEGKWSSADITTPQTLMEQAKSCTVLLARNKDWHLDKATEATALQTERTDPSGDPLAAFKARHAAWKFDRRQSTSSAFSKNGKTCHWCTGPGHKNIGMWVLHQPGTCTGGRSANATTRGGGGRGGGRGGGGRGGGRGRGGGDDTARRSAIASALEGHSDVLGDQLAHLVDDLSNPSF